MRKIGILFLAGLLTLLVVLPLTAKILSHADYARSEPAADEALSTPPTQVKVWFTQELFRREGENWLRVTGPDGARVDLDDTAVDDDDRTLATVSLSETLPDGLYTVAWRGLSAEDGHPGDGEFTFTVAANPAAVQNTPTAAPEATTVPEATAGPSNTGASGGLPCLGATPLAILAIGSVLIGRKKRSNL